MSLADGLTLLWTWRMPWPLQVHSSRDRTTALKSAGLLSNCCATICRWAHALHMGAAGACLWGTLAATKAACMQKWKGGIWQGGHRCCTDSVYGSQQCNIWGDAANVRKCDFFCKWAQAWGLCTPMPVQSRASRRQQDSLKSKMRRSALATRLVNHIAGCNL